MSNNLYRNLDSNWLVLRYEEEVCVKSLVRYWMILYLVEYCITVSSVAELEVDDERVRSVSDFLKILSVDSEENVLHTETIDVARNESCAADSFYACLVASFANLAIEFNVLHCFC